MLTKEDPAAIADPTQTEAYQLDRQATAFKKAGDIDGAIDALRQRKALLGLEYRDDKLAKYLQAAGRFDEAMAEIEWLLCTCQAFALKMFAHQPASLIQSQRCHHVAAIHAAAALICQREKRTDLQASHEQHRDTYRQLREKLEPIAKADQKKLQNDSEKSLIQGGDVARVFYREREARIAANQTEADRLMLQLNQSPTCS